ncbi:hypothetical protein A1O1_02288 [Capronia coronata CBS 617.96]|uniref:Protein YOP1 n=1 Tax=Capronia coronata CBS 617.96 TaxID=1182541 RepID=W9YW65_9EURO|nr:uncharacterized protein A1O1_02288 [Capronia coronata CBS 617.96]EXJ93895.1 hypothetical protein A1O1_02288 [Capronia coronata CBS 617.96]
MFGIVADLIASVTTILLPAYLSYKALRTNDPAQTHPWLIYFTILSLTLLFESWTLFIIGWFPFYSWIRLLFLLYLILPQTQGAKVLYLDYLEPYIVHHESRIDQFIGEVHERLQQMGLGYLNIVIEFIRDKILGQKSPQPHEAQGLNYASYAQDLLSRFSMPGARTNTPTQPGITSAGVYSLVSNLAGAAFSGSPSRSQTAEAASVPPSLFQQGPGDSTAERSRNISAERERLSSLLRALDKEQQNIDFAYGAAPGRQASGSGSTGLKAKSKSEQSFENVDYDDAAHTSSSSSSGSSPPQPAAEGRRTTSGGWIPSGVAGWFGGSGSSGDDGGEDRREKDKEELSQRVSKGWSAARDITEEVSRGMSSGVDTGKG